jgi:hypothetical protein
LLRRDCRLATPRLSREQHSNYLHHCSSLVTKRYNRAAMYNKYNQNVDDRVLDCFVLLLCCLGRSLPFIATTPYLRQPLQSLTWSCCRDDSSSRHGTPHSGTGKLDGECSRRRRAFLWGSTSDTACPEGSKRPPPPPRMPANNVYRKRFLAMCHRLYTSAPCKI